jgi:hypothetical protein
MNQLKNILILALLWLLLPCQPPYVWAENNQPSENQVNAAFVYNVARYVSWPQSTSGSFMIGILGKGSLDRAWLELKGKQVHGRTLEVRKSDDLEELTSCQIIFIGAPTRKNISRILLVLQDHPILTISNLNGFAQSGGMVHLFTENDRIRFKINLSAARQSGLKISAQLLKLAKEVID